MPTNMHRLQISLPEWQTDFLAAQARREGVSMAEVVRRLIQREAEAAHRPVETSSLWDIAGIGEDPGPLIQDVPVSENPELYLTAPRSKRRR
jgi:hypothetical protein